MNRPTVLGDPLDRDDRMALLIDGNHCEELLSSLGLAIDFRRLFELFASEGVIVHARYYAPPDLPDAPHPRAGLHDWLTYNGYSVIRDHPTRRAANPLVHLAVDALDFADSVDHYVIVSGDDSMVSLTQALQNSGSFVTVMSSLQPTPPLVADVVRRSADRFLDATDLAPLIGMPRARSPAS